MNENNHGEPPAGRQPPVRTGFAHETRTIPAVGRPAVGLRLHGHGWCFGGAKNQQINDLIPLNDAP